MAIIGIPGNNYVQAALAHKQNYDQTGEPASLAAALRLMYQGLKDSGNTALIAKLDRLEPLALSVLPFNCFEFKAPEELVVNHAAGSSVKGQGFAKVLDSIGYAETTIETLSQYKKTHPNFQMPPDFKEAIAVLNRIMPLVDNNPAVQGLFAGSM